MSNFTNIAKTAVKICQTVITYKFLTQEIYLSPFYIPNKILKEGVDKADAAKLDGRFIIEPRDLSNRDGILFTSKEEVKENIEKIVNNMSLPDNEHTRIFTKSLHKTSDKWIPLALDHAKKDHKSYDWHDWLPTRLFKSACSTYVSNKVIKFVEIYSKSKDIREAYTECAKNIGTIDESRALIPKIQHTLVNFAKNHISDDKLLAKAIVEVAEMLWSPIEPYDSFLYTAVTTTQAAIVALGEAGTSYTDNFVDFQSVWNL